MIVYRTATPRAALAAAAAAMAAITLALMVVLPAELEASDAPQYLEANVNPMPVASAPHASSVIAESLDSQDDAPGHAALDAPEPCVRPVASSVSPRNRT